MAFSRSLFWRFGVAVPLKIVTWIVPPREDSLHSLTERVLRRFPVLRTSSLTILRDVDISLTFETAMRVVHPGHALFSSELDAERASDE